MLAPHGDPDKMHGQRANKNGKPVKERGNPAKTFQRQTPPGSSYDCIERFRPINWNGQLNLNSP